MTQLPLPELAKALGVLCPPALAQIVAEGVSIDTRTLKPRDLFVALPGERVDGHDYVPRAAAALMAAAIVSRRYAEGEGREPLRGLPCLVVDDPAVALKAIGRFARERHMGPIVGVTGSNGKTTTKELLAAALSGRGLVHKTTGNLNNHFGVPLTLARCPRNAWASVVEMGMSAAGEIAALTALARPDVGLITCVAKAHLAHFASLAAIAAAKAELFANLSAEGVVILNADDAPLVQAAEAVIGQRPVLRFGRGAAADVQLSDDRCLLDADLRPRLQFTLRVGGHAYKGFLPLLGRHNAMNAAGAVAAAWALGVAPDEALDGMRRIEAPPARQNVRPLTRLGLVVIDDCYNANPGSTRAALDALCGLDRPGRKAAVLGDMLELGATAEPLHEQIGAEAAKLGISPIFAVGEHAAATIRGARAQGGEARTFASVDALVAAIGQATRREDTWLIKGSRGMRLERVVAALEQLDHAQVEGKAGHEDQ